MRGSVWETVNDRVHWIHTIDWYCGSTVNTYELIVDSKQVGKIYLAEKKPRLWRAYTNLEDGQEFSKIKDAKNYLLGKCGVVV